MRLALLLLLLATPLAAQDATREVSVELVLLADASGSIDATEAAFQRQGYADAITSPEVIAAIENSLTGTIAVTYVEWATNQAVVVDWMLIDGPETAQAFADAIGPAPRQAYGSNAIGAALLEGQRLIEENDFAGLRRVIDFSGDSMANQSGPGIAEAREQVLAAGITINGLPILSIDDPRRAGRDLERLYTENIIGGAGAFVITADTRASLADAIRRKMVLEIAGLTPDDLTLAEVVE